MSLNFFQKAIAKWIGIPTNIKREVVKDVETTKHNEELRKQLAYKDGVIGRLNKVVKNIKKEKEDVEIKREISEKLFIESKKIEEEELGTFISLDGFYAKLFEVSKNKSTSFKKRLKIITKDGDMAYDYGELGFTSKGFFVVKDKEGNIINMVSLPRKLFKFEAFTNMLKKSMIIMNVDKEGDYIPEFDHVEIPNQIYNEDSHIFVETEELMIKAKDLVREKELENRSLRSKVEQLELAFGDLSNEFNDLASKLLILSKTNKIATADYSSMINSVTESQKKIYEMSTKIVTLSEKTAMQEEKIDSLEKTNSELLEKTNIINSKNDIEKVKAIFQDVGDYIKDRGVVVQTNQ